METYRLKNIAIFILLLLNLWLLVLLGFQYLQTRQADSGVDERLRSLYEAGQLALAPSVDALQDPMPPLALSRRVAERIWKELGIPSFLYEDSAATPERRNLAACRKGQFEGMPEKLLQPEWAPDYGERKIHPTAGITAIGARMPTKSPGPSAPPTAGLSTARPSA